MGFPDLFCRGQGGMFSIVFLETEGVGKIGWVSGIVEMIDFPSD